MRPNKRKADNGAITALTVIEHPTGTEVALPVDIIGKARRYASKSRAQGTLREYARHWKQFQKWCDDNGREALPCGTDTLGAYLTCMADGQTGKRPHRGVGRKWAADHQLSVNTIGTAMAAIKFRHKSKGYVLNTDHPDVQNVWGGIRREKALTRTTRKAKALTAEQLRDIMEMLRPDVVSEARDAAVLALGFIATLRRSEVIGLDWYRLGTEKDDGRLGFLKSGDEGLTVILMKSKASQDTAEDVPIPALYAPFITRAIENWVQVGKIEKGTPLFRAVRGRSWSENPQCGYLGVSWCGGPNPWRAQAKINGRAESLGHHKDPYKAHLAYCEATGTKPRHPSDDPLMPQRMSMALVGRMVKRRIEQWLQAQNKKRGHKKLSKDEIAELVADYSGHSLRAGGITSMARAGVPVHKIKGHSRHKSDAMVMGYIRETDKVTDWVMKKVAF